MDKRWSLQAGAVSTHLQKQSRGRSEMHQTRTGRQMGGNFSARGKIWRENFFLYFTKSLGLIYNESLDTGNVVCYGVYSNAM